MKNIFKLLFISLFATLFIVSCDNEADRDWTTTEPSFTLHQTSPGSNVLYPTMESNPFILTWIEPENGGSYSVVVSSTEDFASKVELGTSDTNTFTTTIGELNTAMLQAGISPYASQTVYVRVESGSLVSNAISFIVTPYPSTVPVITNPTAGSSFVLNSADASSTVTTVTWDDYATYGVAVVYNVEIAASGTDNWVSTGTVTNAKELVWVTSDLNDFAADAGLAPNVEADVDLRVTASTESAGGTLSKSSEIVTFKLTPYIAEYIPLYLVGGGTAAGWNAGGALPLHQNENISEVYTYLTKDGQFRFLGQQDWNPLNYSLNTDGIKDNYKYFNTWPTTIVASGDENMQFSGDSGMYKVAVDQNTRALTITASSLPTVPENLYLVGSLNGWDAANALPMDKIGDGVFEYVIEIPDNSEFKFIGQQAWGDIEYANIHASGNTGFLGPKGDNNNIQFSGAGGWYKITVDVKKGTYKIEM